MDLKKLASQFVLEGSVEAISPLGDGFINDTFLIKTDGDGIRYILQRKNRNVFYDIPSMMKNIYKVTSHIRNKVIQNGGNPGREVMTLIPSKTGELYYQDEQGDYWTVCIFIPDTITYNDLNSLEIARKGGVGIGKFQAQLADFTESLKETIPGFHNIKKRFEQWDRTLSLDKSNRIKDLTEEIQWIESRRDKMLNYRELVDNGIIPQRVTHNDTKINNILFDQGGNVLCVIDLDTVMKAPVHNDFGDSIRTYTNTGAEDDKNLDNVSMDLNLFEAFADGYLSQQAKILTDSEIAYLAFSAIYITFEQVLRFLLDYIDGDQYYKIKYPEHNLIRARAQYKLLQSMEEQYEQMNEIIKKLVNKYKKE